jgi:aminopeptidase N
MIQRALAQIPARASGESNRDPAVTRAKSFLLFYALRDRVGTTNFQLAMQHMLSARRGRGFDITDLISALEEQSHQPVGPFVRQWIKRSGVPDEFRALYSESATQKNSVAQEVAP